MPKVKTKSLGEQLFEIAEAEELKRHPRYKHEEWQDVNDTTRKRYENIAALFAEKLKERETSDA